VCVCVCVCVCVYVHIPANGKPNNPLGVMKLKCIVSMIAICAQGEVYVRTYTRSESHEYVKKNKNLSVQYLNVIKKYPQVEHPS